MSNKVWVYIDQFKGEVHPASWETLGAGLSLAQELGEVLPPLSLDPKLGV
jgi:hypothetical protein